MADDPMWCLVMFDLPVKTKQQQRNANGFRNFLLDSGYWRVQYSCYVKHTPTGGVDVAAVRKVKLNLPPGGQVRMLFITNRQWSSGLRFSNGAEHPQDPAPEQLMFF